MKNISRFEDKHKIISLVIILLTTIIISRIIVFFYDPNPMIRGIEIHHFYYGLVLLLITNLLLLYKRINFKTGVVLSGISIGLIIDELLFISKTVRNNFEYNTTLGPTIITTIVAILVIEFIFYFRNKNKSK